ncbi:MAG TPA: hypothetical protein VHB79_14815 [Polyangiaceae bacterium]|nr:hypothetical protein [Polyangiaceae bacterium]
MRAGLALVWVVGCTGGNDDVTPAAGGNAMAGGTASGGSGSVSGGAGAGATSGGSTASGGTAGSAGTSSSSGAGAGSSAGSAGSGGVGGSAGAAGGGAGGSAASCTTAGNELCEDFEAGQLDAQKWKLTKNPAAVSISVDGEHVHGGKYAAHLEIEAGKQSTAMLTESLTFPAASNSFYARAYMYFTPELPTAPGGDFHMGFILGVGKNDAGDVQAGMGMIGGEKQYLGYSIFYGPPKYEFGPWSKAKVEPNKWACIELFEDGSSPSEEKRQVWLDGTELTDLRSTSANPGAPANHKPPAFDGASFGVWEYHPSPLLSDIWLDDIRVSSKPIGCN